MSADLPLQGITVVELSDNASLPFGGQVLAGLGAEVWKVERPGGDASRGWGPSMWRGSGAAFHALNRGKKSICVDVKDPAQLDMLKDLIFLHADVFAHNLRPGSAGQYGLDPETLRARKPELICCELGAFGHVGPLSRDPGYDPLMQAFSGIMSLTGENGQPPSRSGVSIVDFGSGMWSVIGVISALYRRRRTGQGATVNASLLETAMAWMSVGIANYATDGEIGSRYGSGIAFIVPHRAYETMDGYLIVSCANDRLFGKLSVALDHPEWAVDPRFATNAGRLAHRGEIDGLIGECLARNTREYWKAQLEKFGVASAPIQTTAEIFEHEQTRALGILGRPTADEIECVGVPISFDGVRPAPLGAAPDVGQFNDEFHALLKSARVS